MDNSHVVKDNTKKDNNKEFDEVLDEAFSCPGVPAMVRWLGPKPSRNRDLRRK